MVSSKTNIAVFGGGCFWCTEAVFKMLKGVISVTPGYAGGTKENPNYEEVSSGTTGYAEVIRIEYDPEKILFRDLLTVFFATHDPTIPNRQGNDIGPQYRSVILYASDADKTESEKFIKELNESHPGGKAIVTEVRPLEHFYEAESYHHDYYARNKYKNPYCEVMINPKLQKVQKQFAKLLARNEKMSESNITKDENLPPELYRVAREKGTETPFTGKYWNNHERGMYRCAICGSELFSSDAKFDSGTGWPSFTEPANLENITLKDDASLGVRRTEILCKKCGAHLGHVFGDGPKEKGGKRYCINSVCLALDKTKNFA